MKSNKTGLTIGLLAGVAVVAFALNKFAKNPISKIREQTARLRDSLTKELNQFKRTDNRFI